MSITQGISRSAIGQLFRAKRNFKLRLVSTGLLVKTDYNASVHTLQYGDIIATMGEQSTWVDIGQIVETLARDGGGFTRYKIVLIPRLVECIKPAQKITLSARNITCRLVVVHD